MKAIAIRQFGGPEVLRLEEVPEPRVVAGEVLVRVCAAGVNALDLETRAGRGVARQLNGFPAILGWELSGVVEAVSDAVVRFKIGDRVYGMPRFPLPVGAYAEFAAAPERSLAFKPRNLTHVQAAALPMSALGAARALEVVHLGGDQTFLVHAVGGDVELFTAQFSTVRRARVIALDSDWSVSDVYIRRADIGMSVPLPEPVDAVLDTAGGEVQERLFALVKPGGWLVSTVHAVPQAIRLQRPDVLTALVVAQPNGAHLEWLSERIESGQVRPPVTAAFPLEAAAQVHALLEARRISGKAVLELRSQPP